MINLEKKSSKIGRTILSGPVVVAPMLDHGGRT